jgi:hypothetical protein
LLERTALIGPILPIGTVNNQPPPVGAAPNPQPLHFSYTTFILKQVQDDLGIYALCYVLSLVGQWTLHKSWNISSGTPIYVVVSALALTVIETLSDILLFPPPALYVKFENAITLLMSLGVAAAFVKICHIQVSSIQGMLSFIVIYPLALFVHQIFEE